MRRTACTAAVCWDFHRGLSAEFDRLVSGALGRDALSILGAAPTGGQRRQQPGANHNRLCYSIDYDSILVFTDKKPYKDGCVRSFQAAPRLFRFPAPKPSLHPASSHPLA